RAVPADQEGAAVVVIGYEEEALGIESIYEAAALLRAGLRGEAPEVERALAELREVYRRARPGTTTAILMQAARARGIPVRRTPDEHVVQLGLGCNLRRLDASMTDFTSVIATDATSDKDRTKRLLERVGLPVPRGGVARTLDEALEIAADLGPPVLLKPLDANEGRGISGRLETEEEVRAAWPVAAAESPEVVVERYTEGRDHRVVVVNGRVVAVAERIPAHVVGDGRRSVRELAEEVNRDPHRDLYSPRAMRVPLPLDERTERFLARRGYTLDTVPPAGEWVQLRATANVSTGGTAVDRTDEIHPRNAALCVLAAGAVGLDVAGLDVLTPDISVPFPENGAAIIEVNASPGLRMHTDPDEGTPRDVPGAILDMLYPPGSSATIPVIAVTGTNGKTTTTRLVAHLFRQTGKTVGFTTTDGVYLQETLLIEGDFTGPFAANVVLSHPQVEVAVLETARGGILRSGLGFAVCDVGVVLNVAADHLGMRGIHTVEDLAEVKGVIARVVRPGGCTVLNADDPLVLAMRDRTRGEVVLISMLGERENPEVAGHLSRGGTALLVEEVEGRETFVVRRGEERTPVATVHEVPLTLGGAARFQLQNVLAAIAAAHAQGMDAAEIREALRSFVPSAEATPGRMNLLRTTRGTVIVDYAHNPAAVRALVDFSLRLGARRRIGVVAMPGDRRDEDLRELGASAAGLDYVIIKEHPHYRRGRRPGEGAGLIAEGLRAVGFPPDAYETVLPEPEAVARALEIMEEGDLVLVLADDTTAVLAQVEPLVVRS
ncbi:MAG: cyanophycin synthetase, partial [Gemmatimonadota bacterium]|nr:cyanophycin synthetase [Gemmatimonadota bacterium]